MTGPSFRPSVPTSQWFLICLAGPDRGKRLEVTGEDLIIGRAAESNVLSDDPDVTDRFARLRLEKSGVRIWGLADTLPFVDGHSRMEALLAPGHQVRIGRSLWEVTRPGAGEGVMGVVSRLGDHLSAVAGLEKPRDWRPGEMFSEVVKHHPDEEVESYFTVGTRETTPGLAAVDAGWPRPWVFIRVLVLSVVIYVGFAAALNEFENVKLLPAVIIMGSVAIPFALLIFFFEVNVPRDVSLYQVIKLLLAGGLLAIVISLVGFRFTGLQSWLGAASAGIIEETGKALALVLAVQRPRYRWILNGLLFGAAVGAGFAIFESAGYALEIGIGNGIQAMRESIMTRGLMNLFGGHILWTGLVGAALWRRRGSEPFRAGMLADPGFLKVLGLCIAMHMLWNSPIRLPFSGKYLLLGVVAWFLVLEFIQAGLKQVRQAQAAQAGLLGGQA
ncbi:MAG TPA: PrsW family glutamic-type intramembrane protease [Gemmatimonadales bacterium]|nr:PrsW family glutamic-type intramembrane protease [Gemmatimonadales bacterium]